MWCGTVILGRTTEYTLHAVLVTHARPHNMHTTYHGGKMWTVDPTPRRRKEAVLLVKMTLTDVRVGNMSFRE